MAFLKNITGAAMQAVQGLVQNFAMGGSSPYEVQEISSLSLQNLSK